MKHREKLIICLMIVLIGTFFNVYYSAYMHLLLTREMIVLRHLAFFECTKVIFSHKLAFNFFSTFQFFVLLCGVAYYISNFRPYQSDLYEVTPLIKIPKPSGQFQHGSAWWLSEKEKEEKVKTFILDSNDELIDELLSSGYDDLDFIEHIEKDVINDSE